MGAGDAVCLCHHTQSVAQRRDAQGFAGSSGAAHIAYHSANAVASILAPGPGLGSAGDTWSYVIPSGGNTSARVDTVHTSVFGNFCARPLVSHILGHTKCLRAFLNNAGVKADNTHTRVEQADNLFTKVGRKRTSKTKSQIDFVCSSQGVPAEGYEAAPRQGGKKGSGKGQER